MQTKKKVRLNFYHTIHFSSLNLTLSINPTTKKYSYMLYVTYYFKVSILPKLPIKRVYPLTRFCAKVI